MANSSLNSGNLAHIRVAFKSYFHRHDCLIALFGGETGYIEISSVVSACYADNLVVLWEAVRPFLARIEGSAVTNAIVPSVHPEKRNNPRRLGR